MTAVDPADPRRRLPLLAAAAVVLAGLLVQAGALAALGQPPICTCGIVRLWTGDILGPENSQQIFDWYTPSHVLHGVLFYAAARLLAPRLPLLAAFALAIGLEVTWELIENAPATIARYRTQALAQGYFGDSILNSLSDTLAATTGWLLAARLPARLVVAAALATEIGTAVAVRDNLTLNVLQLIHPIDAVAAWQTAPR